MKNKFFNPLFINGLITLSFWFIDTFNKLYLQHAPYRMLWYSSIGLLLTTIGLLKKSPFILTSMFCALVVIETLWVISFFSHLFFHTDLIKVANYAFVPSFPRFDFLTTLYHILIVPSLIHGILKLKKIHNYGWAGAGVLTLILATVTSLTVRVNDNVNCLKYPCQSLFGFLYNFPQFSRILLGSLLLVILVFYPLNLLLLYTAQKLHWKTTDYLVGQKKIFRLQSYRFWFTR